MRFNQPIAGHEVRGAADVAVSYILDRVVEDRDFSWHMMNTESLRKCVIAEAKRRGASEGEIELSLAQAMNEAQPRLEASGAGEAQLVVARRKLTHAEQLVGELWLAGKIDQEICDQIVDVLKGRALCPSLANS